MTDKIEKMKEELAMYTDTPQHVENILEIIEQAGYRLSADDKDLHCQECGQYLTSATMKHTYEDCLSYKQKVYKSLFPCQRVKCPHCEWSQFESGESVGMTPCYNCNSTGYIYMPLKEME